MIWVVERMPIALLGVLDRTVVRHLDSIPDPVVIPEASIRLYVAPANFAGQGAQWARSVRISSGSMSAVSMAFQSGTNFAFDTDYAVPEALYLYSMLWQRQQVCIVKENFSHVLIEAERPLFGYYYGGRIENEVRMLSDAGVQVALVCHGTDIRLPSRHARLSPDSTYRDSSSKQTRTLEARARYNRALLDRLARPVFVSTPDLLLDVEYAHWLPVVIDAAQWEGGAPPLVGACPLVVHAPSKAGVKGSELIDPILAKLDEEGLIRYRRVHGIPAAEMPAVYREADIVLDQFRLGIYGVAACEAMAAGRLVISHVSEQTRSVVMNETGRELPIVESRAVDLEDVIRSVVADPERFRPYASAGPEFVKGVHDGQLSAKTLNEHFLFAS